MKGVTGDALERRVASSLEPALFTKADLVAAHDDEPAATWRRVRVAEGIEVHVRSDSAAAHEDTVIAMREAVRAALGRFNNGS